MSYDKNNIEFAPKPTHPKFKDIEGQRFGRLTVIGFAGRENGTTWWWCACECGEITRTSNLRPGAASTLSCGCYGSRTRVYRLNRTHGRSGTPEHYIWKTMRSRCNNPNTFSYPNYGGRGITVCERWDSFENFLADMGARPSPKHSIERINNDGPYSPENCKWATRDEQSNNRRSNHMLTHDGRSQSVTQWAAEVGLTPQLICARLRYGWTHHRALTTPVRKQTNNQTSAST